MMEANESSLLNRGFGRMIVSVFVLLGCVTAAMLFTPIIGLAIFPAFALEEPVESINQSYADYASGHKHGSFDPQGASRISHRMSGTRDGYDEWWRFEISETAFESLVAAAAKNNHGPASITFTTSDVPPGQWKARADTPSWWSVGDSPQSKSIHWCFKAGTAERHHGWYFLYNPDANIGCCWRWNHQWSSHECL